MLKILGYADKVSVAPGETITFMVSSEDESDFNAEVVRVIHGDCNPEGPGLKFAPVTTTLTNRYPGRRQAIDAGSYMVVPNFPLPDRRQGFTFYAWIWPTLPAREDFQTILSLWQPERQAGIKLGLMDGGRLTLVTGNGRGIVERVALDRPLRERQWYQVSLAINPARGTALLAQDPRERYPGIDDAGQLSTRLPVTPALKPGDLRLAGTKDESGQIHAHFDGKIDSPVLLRGAHPPETYARVLTRPLPQDLRDAVVAQWDFSRAMTTTRAEDAGPDQLHGELVNLPTRAVTGWNWSGACHNWKVKPEHYGAIHFHHDDLYDAGWAPSLTWRVPRDLPSGPYALKVNNGESSSAETRAYYIAFFVRPPRRHQSRRKSGRPKVAFLAPTCSYLAYANHAEHITAREAERTIGRLLEFGHADLYLYDHPELGGSLYDCHADGSGVAYSSRLRPILTFTPRYHSWLGGAGSGLWQYNADTHLFGWLDHHDIAFDVITDEDLHHEGYAALADYRVVMTGTHPEYYSTAMWDGMLAWIERGGRLMYLGANGWYWRIAFHQTLPGVIEVRRAEDGIRTWAAEPGEYYHAFNGEYGGLWRRIGRPPNLVCGLGFIAQGFDICSYYRRRPDSYDPRAAFIFDGVEEEIIGDFGLIGGGAAGLELDCISEQLGSPPNILRLASSENHTALVQLVNEEFGVVPPNLGGDQNDRVRADLAFYETTAGGAVFSVGSISWCGSLSHNNYDNNVSRITKNVLFRFMKQEPFADS